MRITGGRRRASRSGRNARNKRSKVGDPPLGESPLEVVLGREFVGARTGNRLGLPNPWAQSPNRFNLNGYLYWRSRISSSRLQSMHRVAIGRASSRWSPISAPHSRQ